MKHMKQMHSQIRITQQKMYRWNALIEQLFENRGTAVDDELSQHLTEITKEKSDFIAQSHPDSSFAKAFWEHQCKALSLKKMSSMQWDPIMIRWCLYLRHLSGSSAYEMLRETGVIKLPSQRLLRDYTYYTKTTCGFSDDVDQQLMEAANINTCSEKDKYVILMLDEMHIKEDIVYDKHTGAVIGFANLGDINTHLLALEKQTEVVDSQCKGSPPANSMLVLLVKGLFNRLSFPYAQFPCTALSGELMYDPVWEAISRLELCGFKVLVLICDGLAANRKFFRLHDPDTSPEDILYKVANPYADDTRDLFLLADPPHLIKTVRNAWCNSKRHLWFNGKEISWSHLIKLYNENRSAQVPGLALIPKLKYEHVWLTSYSKMRVDLAAQVLSNSVASAIHVTQGEEAKETANFAEKFDKFFVCLNVSNSAVGKLTRNPFKDPYRSAKDFRLKWLEEMLDYLNEWETSVKTRVGFEDAKSVQNMMLLPLETRQGIQITIKSFMELVNFIFTIPGVEFFYSNRLCQDDLENFFGQQRQRGRTHENPNAAEFLKNTQALRVINNTCATIRGNCQDTPSSKKQRCQIEAENTPLPK